MKAINIQWDVDNDKDLKMLPNELAVPMGMDEEEISDYISNAVGFCHKGFELSKEKTFFDIKEGDFVVIDSFLNHDHEEHILKVNAVEFNREDITITNPGGMVCYGTDLTVDGDGGENSICYFVKDDFVGFYEPYDKEVVELIKDLTKDESLYINKAALVERLVHIDCYFKSRPWNLLQILTNVNMIAEEEPTNKSIEINTPKGEIRAIPSEDSDYPGITVEFIPSDVIVTQTDPTMSMEFDVEESSLNMYTWGDCGIDDYTHKEKISYIEE